MEIIIKTRKFERVRKPKILSHTRRKRKCEDNKRRTEGEEEEEEEDNGMAMYSEESRKANEANESRPRHRMHRVELRGARHVCLGSLRDADWRISSKNTSFDRKMPNSSSCATRCIVIQGIGVVCGTHTSLLESTLFLSLFPWIPSSRPRTENWKRATPVRPDLGTA